MATSTFIRCGQDAPSLPLSESLVMRRLGVGGFDPFQLEGFDRFGKLRLRFAQPRQLARLPGDDLVQLLAQALNVREVGLKFGKPLLKVVSHAVRLNLDAATPTKNCLRPPPCARILSLCAAARS